MEVKKWQRKVWLLARYLEVAVPVTFAVFMIWVCSRKMPIPLTAFGMLIVLVCAGMHRDLAESIHKRQAQDWLASIVYKLTEVEAEELKTQIEGFELRICRVQTLIPVIVLIALAYTHIRILSPLAQIVVDVIVGGFIIAQLLMARMLICEIRDKIAKEWHSV